MVVYQLPDTPECITIQPVLESLTSSANWSNCGYSGIPEFGLHIRPFTLTAFNDFEYLTRWFKKKTLSDINCTIHFASGHNTGVFHNLSSVVYSIVTHPHSFHNVSWLIMTHSHHFSHLKLPIQLRQNLTEKGW